MILFIMQRMHHDPFYNAKDAPWSFLHCNGCNMLLFILLWMHHDHLFIAMNAQCYLYIAMKHHVSFYIKLYSLCASCSFLYCNGCTMFLFMLQFMHHIFYIAIDAPCSFLYCNGCIMFLFYNAMDAPCSFLYCNGGTIFLFIMQWMHHDPFYIAMDAPCSFFMILND